MTAATDQFATIAQRSQEAATAAMRAWTDALQNAARSIPAPTFPTVPFAETPFPQAADVHAAVDVWFDLVNRLVAEQHALATTLVDAGAAFGAKARTAAEDVRSATENTVNGHAR